MRVGEKQGYGRMEIEVEKGCGLFGNKRVGDKQVVWISHGDEAVILPEGFKVVARSQQGAVATVEDKKRRFYGLQYHPDIDLLIIFWIYVFWYIKSLNLPNKKRSPFFVAMLVFLVNVVVWNRVTSSKNCVILPGLKIAV